MNEIPPEAEEEFTDVISLHSVIFMMNAISSAMFANEGEIVSDSFIRSLISEMEIKLSAVTSPLRVYAANELLNQLQGIRDKFY